MILFQTVCTVQTSYRLHVLLIILSIYISKHLINKSFRSHVINLSAQTFFFIQKFSNCFLRRNIFHICSTDTCIDLCDNFYIFPNLFFLQKIFCKCNRFFEISFTKVQSNPPQRIMPFQKSPLLHFLLQLVILFI